MASDHRGRPLHAGKRTVQDAPVTTGFAEGPKGGYTWGFSLDAKRDGDPHHFARAYLFKDTVVQPTEQLSGNDIEATHFNLDRGKTATALDIYDKEGYHQQSSLTFSGKARTRARAEIAGKAMQKRIDEGRSLRTGRPY